ncbi:MAG TPA: ATP-binding protein [Ramlibacter sp.]|nr:ATP-binding protein [Ramlibacter sp.]
MNNSDIPKPFNLLRWFSLVSLAALLPVAGMTGALLAHFLNEEALQRDASLTAQFIQNCVTIEGNHIGLGPNLTLPELMNPRVDPNASGVSTQAIDIARANVLEHLETLPDVLLASLFTRDGRIIWSTNKSLIGTLSEDNDELQEAFSTRRQIATHYSSSEGEKEEQKFVVQPKEFFIENYIPLFDSKGEVVLVAEVYKEPRFLTATIERGRMLVWGTTLGGGVLIYLGLFSIIRRGSRLLEQQQRQLAETDSLVYVGEMATALAHSLRSPLASVRSSAELALMTDDLPVRKNAQDIITQVDFLSKWVRELLLYSRPLTAEPEAVDLVAVLDNVLDSFKVTCAKAGVQVQWSHAENDRPMVEGNTSLMRQALHSVVSNAIEAMPAGGELRIDMRLIGNPRQVELTITDTGVGMSTQQLAMAFKPFHTTKRHGLGVGLPMLKRVMERFGGAVALSSGENAGTQVRLQFRMN